MKKTHIFIIFILFFTTSSFSEIKLFKKRSKSLDVSVGHMNITYPWYMASYFKSYNPYLSLELNRTLRNRNLISLIHPIEVGVFFHKYIENTIFIQSGIGMEIQKNHFFFSMDLSGGYAHWFNKREVLMKYLKLPIQF